ncbi:putative ORFan [Tupanvirus deep ocean]|uniref:ORFan n=2 Tax=Tupanvirus TaxID=2094720 RepID=A0AC62A8R8_9VIRU|nr:putative ORFan [Tupanvirus deep ocean]QKU34048.1 putative ORFan [Tupanvirus deep ocean]
MTSNTEIVNVDDTTTVYGLKSFSKVNVVKEIVRTPFISRINNNCTKNVLLKIGLFNIKTYNFEPIGITVLPAGKTYTYHNRFPTKILQISLGYPGSDVGDDTVDVVCYDILVFGDFEINDSFVPYKNMKISQFSTSERGCDDPAEADKLICDRTTFSITNESSNGVIFYLSIRDVVLDSTYCVGWMYLPINCSYTLVNEFASKIFCVSAGIPSKNIGSDMINIFCEDIPIFEDIIIDDSYVPFKKITYAEFTTGDESDEKNSDLSF